MKHDSKIWQEPKFLKFTNELRKFCCMYEANQSKLYNFESSIMKVGHKKILIDIEVEDNKPQFFLVVSARLREELI